jgi:hypothetical protein
VNPLYIIYIVALVLFPIIGTLITSIFYAVAGKEIPPLLPQINGFSVGQAAIALVATFQINKEASAGVVIASFILFLSLIVILFFQTLIDKKQEQLTKEHVSEVLQNANKVRLKQGFAFTLVEKIGHTMVAVDLFPDSWPNQWSNYPRKSRREQLVEMINQHMTEDSPQSNPPGAVKHPDKSLKQEDFLIPDTKGESIRRQYVILTVVSLFCYLLSIALFVSASQT